jgi:hypothetical protein
MFLLLLKPLKIFIFFYFSIPRRALSGVSTPSDLHGDSGSACPRRYNTAIAEVAAKRISLIFLLTAPNGDGDGPTKLVHD